MERPPSQLENVRPSGIKQPSRLPAMAHSSTRSTLLETSQSELNARHGHHGGFMGPPATNGSIKHKIPGLPESATKQQRRTLIERAAEPLSRSNMPPPPPRTNGTRTPATHGHARSASAISAPAYTNGVRPESRQRVLSAEEEAEAEAGVTGKRKGTPVMSFNHLKLRKTRTQGSLRTYQRVRSDREDSSASQLSSRHASDGSTSSEESALPPRSISLTSAFAQLSLTPPPCHPSAPRHTPSLNGIKEEASPSKIPKFSCTPRLRHIQSTQALQTPSPLKHKSSVNGMYTPHMSAATRKEMPFFLTKDSLTLVYAAWDTKGRLEDMESLYGQLRTQFAAAADSKTVLEESLALYKSRVQELTHLERELTATNRKLTTDVERARSDLHTTTTDLRQARRDHERDMQDIERKYDRELADVTQKLEKDVDQLSQERDRDVERFRKETEEAKRKWQRQKDDEAFDMGMAHAEELEEVKKRVESEKADLQRQLNDLKNAGESRATESASEVQELRNTIAHLRNQLEATNATVTSLRARVAAEGDRNAALEQEKTALVSKTHFLEGNQEAQSFEFTTMRQKLQDAVTVKETTLVTLRKEEMLRRKLNATILELRGNIRVFVRIRPLLAGEEEAARVDFPDGDALDGGKEMVVHAPTTLSATGKERNEKHNYGFDRVFAPMTANGEVYEGCRDLIQSVVDGYNVSILSYGQTGSGKTYGMSGPEGIIPSAIALLLAEMQRLQEKGWEYVVEASFVEVYNETLNDLLGDAKTWDEGDDLNGSVRGKRKEKHEIHHDAQTGKTTVNNLSSVTLWPPPSPPTMTASENRPLPAAPTSDPPPAQQQQQQQQDQATHTQTAVTHLLATAAKNRRVAATKSNERSSRSHSIFILTLRGHCDATGEHSEGVLNLVDLAGSERLKVSGAAGERARETAAINRSLAALGDVVAALGAGGGGKKGGGSGDGGEGGHVPFRNSKLTYLLQSSLGGTAANGKSSRTLMLLHLSPLLAHWQESRSSLLFGSKVHGTHIGAAKKR